MRLLPGSQIGQHRTKPCYRQSPWRISTFTRQESRFSCAEVAWNRAFFGGARDPNFCRSERIRFKSGENSRRLRPLYGSMGRPMLNICGRRFGRLTIPLDAKPEVRKRCLYWPCICDCGTQTVVRGEFLRTGITKSCGCLRASLARESLRGRRFGRLTIPQDATPEFRHHHPYWPCVCDCGAKRSVRDEVLLDGRTKSCGCLRADPSMRKAAKILLHDLCGRRFGRLVVPLNAVPEIWEHHLYWPCVCDCDAETVVRGDFLRNGRTTNCGCLSSETALENRSETGAATW